MNHEKTDKAQQSRHRMVRWAVLGLVTVLMAAVGYLHQHPFAGITPPGVDALCPFGGLESLWSVVSSGVTLQRVAASAFILLVASLGITVVFRRAFCGQLCPLGALQGGAAAVGKRLFKKRFRLPAGLDRPLRWLKYGVLVVIVVTTIIAGALVVRPYDPWVAFMHLSSDELWAGFGVGALILVGSLMASLVYDRFFCKYLCPMGAFYAIVSKVGLFRVQRLPSACIACGKCDKVCPVDLPVSQGGAVTSAECLACGLCVNACPAQGALAITGLKNTKISPLVLTLATVGVFFGVVIITIALGWFEIGKKSLAAEVQGVPPSAASAEASSSTFDPDLIKGRHTFAEISDLSGIPRQAFVKRFSLPEGAVDLPIKDTSAQGGFTTGDVRTFVAQSLGLTDYVNTESEKK